MTTIILPDGSIDFDVSVVRKIKITPPPYELPPTQPCSVCDQPIDGASRIGRRLCWQCKRQAGNYRSLIWQEHVAWLDRVAFSEAKAILILLEQEIENARARSARNVG